MNTNNDAQLYIGLNVFLRQTINDSLDIFGDDNTKVSGENFGRKTLQLKIGSLILQDIKCLQTYYKRGL